MRIGRDNRDMVGVQLFVSRSRARSFLPAISCAGGPSLCPTESSCPAARPLWGVHSVSGPSREVPFPLSSGWQSLENHGRWVSLGAGDLALCPWPEHLPLSACALGNCH